eukprot:1384646-Pleurochrysis_carterae.AAC.1
MLHDTFVGEPDGKDEHAPPSPAAALPQPAASGADTSRAVRAGARSTARLQPDAPTLVRFGDVFVVPAEAYPNENCCELGGLGWR